eukprot:5341009-Karenia_brevis.AAC.1
MSERSISNEPLKGIIVLVMASARSVKLHTIRGSGCLHTCPTPDVTNVGQRFEIDRLLSTDCRTMKFTDLIC